MPTLYIEDHFGPFAPAFQKGELEAPGHLMLLHLHSPQVQIVVDRVEAAIRAGDTQRWLAAMMHDVNWRPHLVGTMVYLLAPTLDVTPLWEAIDHGSWVTPQLVVTAAHVDPQVRVRLCDRVEAHCPVRVPADLTPLERHSATGPERASDRSSKMVASMLAIAGELSELADWRAHMLADARVKTMLAADASFNGSDHIVASWLGALRAVFVARGRTLSLVL